MPYFRAVQARDLPPGRKKIVEINGQEIALFNVNKKIHAVSNICPHNGGSLGEGVLSGETVICPLHSWTFNVVTGESSSQPGCWVETYPVKIEKDWIYLNIPAEDSEE